ncbi:patatin-like phospholipase family protein [Petrotoga olearia]|uniref:Patatin n=2 Tax=Petrotoga olearia TaxID=156203 RepID=A0A2K1NWK5_9BACT|nr:patatin-like phospholipase family protein [Petrotoga olearia]PNR94921.1 Patatin [Petrotoga olearia DSM 13574]RMA73213.1 NTE family protein [Petrotoga olearia]
MTYGIALGSGGARGAAHIALIDELKEREAKIEVVTGSSVGALVGAFYALNPDVDLFQIFKDLTVKKKKALDSQFRTLNNRITNFPKMVAGKSFLKNDFVYDIYKQLYGRKRFSDCKIQLGIVSYDLESGEEVEITEGYIIDSVMASSSVPGVFPPLRLGGMNLLDGGILTPIPVNLAKQLGADYVIASDLNGELKNDFKFNDGLDYLISMDDYKNDLMVNYEVNKAEEVYTFPIEYSWEDFSNFIEIYQDAKNFLKHKRNKVRE